MSGKLTFEEKQKLLNAIKNLEHIQVNQNSKVTSTDLYRLRMKVVHDTFQKYQPQIPPKNKPMRQYLKFFKVDPVIKKQENLSSIHNEPPPITSAFSNQQFPPVKPIEPITFQSKPEKPEIMPQISLFTQENKLQDKKQEVEQIVPEKKSPVLESKPEMVNVFSNPKPLVAENKVQEKPNLFVNQTITTNLNPIAQNTDEVKKIQPPCIFSNNTEKQQNQTFMIAVQEPPKKIQIISNTGNLFNQQPNQEKSSQPSGLFSKSSNESKKDEVPPINFFKKQQNQAKNSKMFNEPSNIFTKQEPSPNQPPSSIFKNENKSIFNPQNAGNSSAFQGSGSSGTSSMFGGNAATTGNIFGGNTSTGNNMFAKNTSTGTNMFGGNNSANSGNSGSSGNNVFGGNTTTVGGNSGTGNTFGGNTSTGNMFGGNAPTTGNMFGGNSATVKDNSAAGTNVFGGNASKSNIFGGNTTTPGGNSGTGGNMFGGNSSQGNMFENKSSGTSIFSKNNSDGNNMFGGSSAKSNIFGGQSGSGMFQKQENVEEGGGEEEEGEDDDGLYKTEEEVIDPSKSTGNYSYGKFDTLYKEVVGKLRKGTGDLLENVTVSVQKLPNNKYKLLCVRMANKCIYFYGSIIPQVTEITRIKQQSYKNISVKKVVGEKEGKSVPESLKIQFKEEKHGRQFMESCE